MEEKIELLTKIFDCIVAASPIVASIIGVLCNIKPEYMFIYAYILLIVIVLLLCFILYIIWKNYKLSNEISEINREISRCEKKLYYSLLNSYKRDESLATIYDSVTEKLKEYATLVSKILSKYVKKNVTVSIRFFAITKIEEDIKIEDKKLKVLGFSKNCKRDRETLFKNDKTSIKTVGKNTDFKVIVGEDNTEDYFYERNLKKFRDYYRNENKDWEKFYYGRIVVPICMEGDCLFFREREQIKDRDIKGFLCADVEEKNAFPKIEVRKKFLLDLMESYANKLYIILNNYYYYLTRIDKGIKHDKDFNRITKRYYLKKRIKKGVNLNEKLN